MSAPGLLLLLLGQASALPAPNAGMAVPPQAPQEAADARPAGLASPGYRIGPGDVLQIAVYGHDELTGTAVVQPGGSLLVPLLGPVVAAGATTEEVGSRIARQLAKGFVRDAEVSVTVRDYRSQVVYVVGDVARPGTYPLAGATRIVEVLSRAGPLQTAGNEVLIVRPLAEKGRPMLPSEVSQRAQGGATGGADARVLHVDVRAIQKGRLAENVLLEPNDTVFVPPVEQVFVTGEVRNPGAFAFREGMTARQAVALAGGYAENASKGGAQVVRETAGKPRTLKLKLDEPLQPGDTVVIKKAWF